MKTSPRFRPLVVSTVVLLTLTGAPAPDLQAESAAADEPKDHMLFVGLDLRLQAPPGLGAIRSVTRSTAQIIVAGRTETVALRDVRDVRIAPEPKVSSTVLTLSEPKGLRTFSPATNPRRDQSRQQMDTIFLQEMKMAAAEGFVKVGALMPVIQPRDARTSAAQERSTQERNAAADNMNLTQSELGADIYDPGSISNRSHTSTARELVDAYDVTFTIASPVPIENAFAALVMIVRAPTAPNQPLQTVMFRQLPRLTSEPRKITMQQRGLPQGFAVDRVNVHIYASDRELASNLSERSVAVTRTEAHQFLLIRYSLENKHQNLPAALVPDFLPTDFAANVPEAEWDRVIDVHVNRAGVVESAGLDSALSPQLVSYVEPLVHSARFFPALLDGEPVASDTTVTLREFVR